MIRVDSNTNNDDDNDGRINFVIITSLIITITTLTKKTNRMQKEGLAQYVLECTLIDPSFFSLNDVIWSPLQHADAFAVTLTLYELTGERDTLYLSREQAYRYIFRCIFHYTWL